MKSTHLYNTVVQSSVRSFKIVMIFNIESVEVETNTADVLLEMITIVKELRIVQLCFKNEQTLVPLTI